LRKRPLTDNTRFAGDFEFFYALTANRARPHSLGLGLDLRGAGDEALSVYNPNHVTADTKKQLLIKILRDHQVENPGQDAMGFAEIREVLKNRYKIETKPTGLFFRNEIQDFETRGGNKRKFIVLPKIVK